MGNAHTQKKPRACPFCGTLPQVISHMEENGDAPFERGVAIRCDNCGVEMHEEYRSDAIARWNRRVRAARVAAGGDEEVPQ